MVRPVPDLRVWWAISYTCLSLLRLLGPTSPLGAGASGLVLRSRCSTTACPSRSEIRYTPRNILLNLWVCILSFFENHFLFLLIWVLRDRVTNQKIRFPSRGKKKGVGGYPPLVTTRRDWNPVKVYIRNAPTPHTALWVLNLYWALQLFWCVTRWQTIGRTWT
jgi:hypothetical protein